ncbi:carbon-nitrogen hydrolase [Aliifodinibius sp. S!AR15-10]|uniref:carbon-nitrogen hydrolase n=1 Tax=Aliifodinibius sp. S!AR15-10 TaxID=2950437 RepID=UPI00285BCE2C|nr:carbon-nitrogen hydrolase [Aliifodinibius sp. S!AR15-10]MDR8391097.1 carbon-nitrogen hydrolase [Aliifodinibius sp. S!AR15-10]
MSDKIVCLGLIQHSCNANPSDNVEKAISLVKRAAKKGAQIVFLQELFNTTYFCQTVDDTHFSWAEPIPGATVNRMAKLARELEIVLLVPLFERRAAGIYHNSIAVIDADGTILGRYRKKHIPDDPSFYEKYYFTPGEDEYQVFDTKYAKIGPLICWDQWYPEAARITALKGAEILVYPTAIGTLPEEDEETAKEFFDAWQTIQRSHAIANGCFVASINRVGEENEVTFWGGSFVAGPFGQMLRQAGKEEQVLITEVDLSKIEKQRQVWPFFRDRRIDTYGPILKRFIDD